MPMTYAQHEKKLRAPAVCELLPLRDLPAGDNRFGAHRTQRVSRPVCGGGRKVLQLQQICPAKRIRCRSPFAAQLIVWRIKGEYSVEELIY
jgi:hypothetical protein